MDLQRVWERQLLSHRCRMLELSALAVRVLHGVRCCTQVVANTSEVLTRCTDWATV